MDDRQRSIINGQALNLAVAALKTEDGLRASDKEILLEAIRFVRLINTLNEFKPKELEEKLHG